MESTRTVTLSLDDWQLIAEALRTARGVTADTVEGLAEQVEHYHLWQKLTEALDLVVGDVGAVLELTHTECEDLRWAIAPLNWTTEEYPRGWAMIRALGGTVPELGD